MEHKQLTVGAGVAHCVFIYCRVFLACTTEAHLSVCETSPKLITAHMQENISHDQCQSGGGKNKPACFHSFHLANISTACISEPSLSALIGAVTSSRARWDPCSANGNEPSGWKEESVSLGNCRPSVLPITQIRSGNLRNLPSCMLFLQSVRKRTGLT